MAEYPKSGKPRTINVDEWLRDNERGKVIHNPPVIKRPSIPQQRDAVNYQKELQKNWHTYHENQAREPRLEGEAKECSECGTIERYYKDDYMCFKCRDTLDESE